MGKGKAVYMIDENDVIGNYRILYELTTSSSSRVYVAQHNVLTSRTVAIKLMLSAPLDSAEKRENFLQEARFLEMLKHPYILPIYDVSIHNGIPYLVTEFARHGSLRQRLKEQYPSLLPMEESLTILSQIGQALEFAHQQHIIHRDLKPENILFNAKGDALLMDFGIATMLDNVSIKMVDNSGTPAYMAPEQFRGKVSKESDQYALGCIAYELFTGHPPFADADYFALGFKHISEPPLAPTMYNPQLSSYIEQAVLKALAKERTERHPDIQAFIHAVQVPLSSRQSLPTLPAMPTRTDIAALSKVQETPFSQESFSSVIPPEQAYSSISGHIVREQEIDSHTSSWNRSEEAISHPTTPIPPTAPLYLEGTVSSVYQESLVTPQVIGHAGEGLSTGDSWQSESVWSLWENTGEPDSSSTFAQVDDNALPFAQRFRRGFKERKGIFIALTGIVLLIVLVGVLFLGVSEGNSSSKSGADNNPTTTGGTSVLTPVSTSTAVPQSTATHKPGAHATATAHQTTPPVATSTVGGGPAPTPTSKPKPTPTPTNTPTPTDTPTPTPTDTPTPTPTDTPTPTPTATPTPTDTPTPTSGVSETLAVSPTTVLAYASHLGFRPTTIWRVPLPKGFQS